MSGRGGGRRASGNNRGGRSRGGRGGGRGGRGGKSQGVCFEYQFGNCKFGEQCWFKHVIGVSRPGGRGSTGGRGVRGASRGRYREGWGRGRGGRAAGSGNGGRGGESTADGDASALYTTPRPLSYGAAKPTIQLAYNKGPNPTLHAFSWPIAEVTEADEKAAATCLVKPGEFLSAITLPTARLDEIVQSLSHVCTGGTISLEQALSLREAAIQERIMHGHFRMVRAVEKTIHHKWTAGAALPELVAAYDFAPAALLRALLGHDGFSKDAIKKGLKNPADAPFDGRPQEACVAAAALDGFTGAEQSGVSFDANAFEDAVVEYFVGKGVRVERQEVLTAQQMKEFGRPVATPDLLFLDNVSINGKEVNWVDAKNFYGVGTRSFSMQRKSVAKQATRYIQQFGPGAMLFRYGYGDTFWENMVEGCIPLGPGDIPIPEATMMPKL